MTKAVKLTEDVIDDLVEWGAQKGFNLDYLKDTYEFHAEDGDEVYVIVSPDQWNPCTITETIASDFFRNWKIVDGDMDRHFNEIERI